MWILIGVLAAVACLWLVFRVRVVVAGGKFALALLVVVGVAWWLWPKRK